MIGSTVVLFAALVTAVNLLTAARQDVAGAAGRVEAAVQDSLRIASVAEAVHVLEARRDSIAERLRLVLEMDAQRYVWPHLMDEIAGALPREAWLTRLARATSPEGGVRLHIEGRGQGGAALTRFWNRMEASPFMRDVRLINSERIERPLSGDAEELYQFVLEAEHETPDPELIELVAVADTAAW
ncbi:MAG: PilN domain-containing protein [Gemmatimonadota bacterium]|nr:PilN domain-containing protein [Gemmatimonadota bacterium]